MPLQCAGCQATLPIDPSRVTAGKRLRCPHCGDTFAVGGTSPKQSPPPVPSAVTPTEPAEVSQSWKLVLAGGILAVVLLTVVGVGVVIATLARSKSGDSLAHKNSGDLHPNDADAGKPNSGDGFGVSPIGDGSPPIAVPRRGDDDAPRPRVPELDPVLGVPKFAMFMGTKAMGNRFCIIADVSGSMARFNRIDRLRKETKMTLSEMDPEQEFHIIFFHSSADAQPERGWVRAAKAEKVISWIEGQRPRGSTQPMRAFQLAFDLKPLPDAIFFMTDGMIPPNVPAEVAKLNAKVAKKVPIYTIMFGGEVAGEGKDPAKDAAKMAKRANESLEPISKQSGGTHRFVPDEKGDMMMPKIKQKK